ncbi:hypothetical protein MRB53_031407 [Persea americana]|uniref:Uncharacterized protein n=1 Tax=Persea americana TaxID=3435 RepID=A0ACC2KP89_PERAE|nr:hypothetical protein MRB53_031407 [Persea americana]
MFFFHISIPFNSLFLFFYFSSISLTKFFLSHFRRTTSTRNYEFEDDFTSFSEDGDIGFFKNEYQEKEDLVANIIRRGEELLFLHSGSSHNGTLLVEEGDDHEENEVASVPVVDQTSSTEYLSELSVEEENAPEIIEMEDSDQELVPMPKPMPLEPYHEILLANDGPPKNKVDRLEEKNKDDHHPEDDKNTSSQDEGFVVINPRPQNTKSKVHEDESEEILVGSFAGGSTSHSSYEWRSSTNYRGSETEDPFSSSSRRSSSRWENYTMFKKYDEEMMFFDRISAQKLTETESLRSVQIQPRSVSQRIVHKLTTKDKQLEVKGKNPYQELEAAYVAQICLTWEALSWNYKNFIRSKASQGEEDSGCQAQIAQEFQQFQVLLQRYIENEPYEHGHRPEVYARMRNCSPRLLQVPEFQADGNKEDFNTKISSKQFLIILEDAIRTFMNFLRADKRSNCQILRDFFKKKQASFDPTLLHLMKKANKKKKVSLEDVRRRGKCFKKKRLKGEEEMEILMGLIDLKVVSRVLRMSGLTYEQLQWCEEKMSHVRVWEGKLQRDSSPLFFPSH